MYIRLFVFTCAIISANSAIVKVKNGEIEGTSEVSRSGHKYDVFYAVPFAAPPIGKLRLQSPVEAAPWQGVRKATQKGPVCVQPVAYGVVDTGATGQEDCLYLNVFTPNASDPNSKLPVLVYIHGGAFQSGAGAYYDPKNLMDKNIVYVSVNYRLGPLGFLSLANDIIPGNYGLKDQAFAFKWVKENIAAFGGNPDDVTIMGESAGGSAVHFHFFSPLSEGLFHKAIIMSGSAFPIWSHYPKVQSKALGVAFAVATGCYYNDQHAILQCLQNVSAEDFVKKESRLYTWASEPTVLFKPAVERDVKDAFLPNEPHRTSYVTKNVPMLVGMTSAEGGFKVAQYFGGNNNEGQMILNNLDYYLPLLFQYKYSLEPSRLPEVTQKIKDFYFGKKDDPDLDLRFSESFTDSWFSVPFIDMVRSYQGTKYAYLFDHRANYSTQSEFGNYSKDLGVCHEDDLNMIMYRKNVDDVLTATDKVVSQKMVDYWTNFVIHGDPNGLDANKLWKPVSTNDVEYLHIKTKDDIMESKQWHERITFWESLPTGSNRLLDSAYDGSRPSSKKE